MGFDFPWSSKRGFCQVQNRRDGAKFEFESWIYVPLMLGNLNCYIVIRNKITCSISAKFSEGLDFIVSFILLALMICIARCFSLNSQHFYDAAWMRIHRVLIQHHLDQIELQSIVIKVLLWLDLLLMLLRSIAQMGGVQIGSDVCSIRFGESDGSEVLAAAATASSLDDVDFKAKFNCVRWRVKWKFAMELLPCWRTAWLSILWSLLWYKISTWISLDKKVFTPLPSVDLLTYSFISILTCDIIKLCSLRKALLLYEMPYRFGLNAIPKIITPMVQKMIQWTKELCTLRTHLSTTS